MGNVLVYLWFDVEDYVTPEADEPPRKIVEILSSNHVRATFKIVAEKVRALKERGREDVIAAFSGMDIGYHLDTHSRHPTLYEYLSNKDLKTGAAEFLQREMSGYDFVKNTFHRGLSCFGHPGPTWAPQVYPALHEMGIPVYLDETSILNIGDSPYWYCNVLNLNGAGRNFINLDYFFEHANGLERMKRRFKEIYRRLHAKRRGGAVSILFHLHTIVNTEFWDEVNFAHGRNPSINELVRPPAQPFIITDRAYRDFEELVEYVKSFVDVEFITAQDATSIFQDTSTQLQIDQGSLRRLLERTLKEIHHMKLGDSYLSPAQIFHITTEAGASYGELNTFPERLCASRPLGPLSKKKTNAAPTLPSKALLEASRNVLRIMETEGHIPSEIVVDKSILTPEDYLVTLSSLLVQIHGNRLPDRVRVRKGRLTEKKYVNSRAFEKACKWVLLPTHFSAAGILEQTLLQTWTLKPAIAAST
jgi:hypothetical protein